ncbi:MAG: hypothetical protein CMF59_17720 [Leptospiraceae bacterium]|nr:hypothetical protein [Leptospiraceae bacterium]
MLRKKGPSAGSSRKPQKSGKDQPNAAANQTGQKRASSPSNPVLKKPSKQRKKKPGNPIAQAGATSGQDSTMPKAQSKATVVHSMAGIKKSSAGMRSSQSPEVATRAAERSITQPEDFPSESREKSSAYSPTTMDAHIQRLLACRKCPEMQGHPVHGCVKNTKIISLGQAPGTHEERFGRPFAYTAGKTLFKWFSSIGIEEEDFRRKVNMSAVCRCFPGKAKNGDRKPSRDEVEQCLSHLEFEIGFHRPELIIPIGKLAIDQLLEKSDRTWILELRNEAKGKGQRKRSISAIQPERANQEYSESESPFLSKKGRASYKLDQVIGLAFRSEWFGVSFDWIALPHPSGLNVWNHTEVGKACIGQALVLLAQHPAIRRAFASTGSFL